MKLLSLPTVLLLAAQLATSGQATSGVIDGKKNPELIPDDVAFRMMFLMISDGPAALTRPTRLGYMEKAALPEKQIDIIIDAANQYRIFSNMAIWRAVQAKADSRTSSGTLIEETFRPRWKIIQGDLDGHLADILLALEIDLGQTDYQKLLAFIRTKVKAEIEYGAGEGR